MYRTDFWILWEKARVGCFERTASEHVYYQGWNRSPAQVGCMRQVLMAGALGRPRGMGWGGKWEGVSGWGTHASPWLIHVNVWQKPLQYCKLISLQRIKINGKKRIKSNTLALCTNWKQFGSNKYEFDANKDTLEHQLCFYYLFNFRQFIHPFLYILSNPDHLH